ncbi:MAG: lipoprotein ABC transporter ATP-binding protein [Gemmatimonadetes bacterium RBG_16_66_8]|nr:MAG: lipoprotein ABC transporter ATP-binding protein [Gemmatimonadetes bacterium RBG_16_66_8]
MTPVLEARGVRKTYRGGGDSLVEVLNQVDMTLHRGEVVAIVGASGAGKSTLLHLLGALDEPTSGEVLLDGVTVVGLSEAERDRVRNRYLGFVFQFHHLLREFSALENVMMPLRIAGWPAERARSRAEEVLASVGLAGRMTHRPPQLSGGEQQRCAVARALVHDPRVLLADEPSGNLDHTNSGMLHDLLIGLVRTLETALVVVTHNRALAERADRILLLDDGRLHPVRTAEAVP